MICVAISTAIRIDYSALPEGFELSRPDAIAEVGRVANVVEIGEQRAPSM